MPSSGRAEKTVSDPRDRATGDDDGGFEGPDIETSTPDEDESKGELDDSADSYASPTVAEDPL